MWPQRVSTHFWGLLWYSVADCHLLHNRYSYDAVKFNKRVYEYAKAHGGMATESNGGPDIISYKYKRYNRGRVPWSIMNEIGYEDCDFVSLEREWQSWKNVAAIWPVELHVPCRDPLEHLMSQCNYQDLQFNCTAIDLHHEVESCLLHPNRFSAKLLHVKNLTLRCFNPTPMEPYIAYIDRFLERKRIEVTYVHRNTNNARDRNDECIWKNQKVMDLVKEILSSFDYYRWCNHCIGSENELFSIN